MYSTSQPIDLSDEERQQLIAPPEIMESWVRAYRHELDADGDDPDALLGETVRPAPTARRSTERLLNRSLESIARLSSVAACGR